MHNHYANRACIALDLVWDGDTVVAVKHKTEYLVGDHPGFELARQAAGVLAQQLGSSHHDIGVVLGSGWAHTIDALGEIRGEASFSEIPGLVGAGGPGHVRRVTPQLRAKGPR